MPCDRQDKNPCWGQWHAGMSGEDRVVVCEGHAPAEYKPMEPARAAVLRLMAAVRDSESQNCGLIEGWPIPHERVVETYRELVEARDDVYLLLNLITEKGTALADPLESE